MNISAVAGLASAQFKGPIKQIQKVERRAQPIDQKADKLEKVEKNGDPENVKGARFRAVG